MARRVAIKTAEYQGPRGSRFYAIPVELNRSNGFVELASDLELNMHADTRNEAVKQLRSELAARDITVVKQWEL